MDQDAGKSGPANPFRKSARPGTEPTFERSPEVAIPQPSGAEPSGARPLPVPPSGDDVRETDFGKELAALFKDKRVHPVFIFGSKGSGKTSLIASMLKYMRDRVEADATVELAEWVLPDGEGWWSTSASWSRDLFYRKVLDYLDNVAPRATLEEQPFFVPVKLTRRNQEEVLFAFLEGQGEWYQPDLQAEVPFRRFKSFLHGMLQGFNDKATVVYIAPFVTESSMEASHSSHLRESDLGLLGAIDEYSRVRKAFAHQDHHLFLLTKWDVYCESVVSPSFLDPRGEEIVAVLRERYPLAWTRYMNAAFSIENQNKSYSTYCSGLINGQNIVLAAEGDDENVAFYARKLWDWLYGNATGGALYPDVRPRPPGLLDRVLKWLRS